MGGKGASLIALARAGFPVPNGFVIGTDSIATMGTPETLTAIVSAWSALAPGGEPVAVRSSATDEDSARQSFAGQYETVLGVRSREALLDAVQTCVASLKSTGAEAYRTRDNAAGRASMAVIVQRMVEPIFSGVAFSLDPVTGDRECVVIEVVRGTGDRLMSGEVEGLRLTVERGSRELRHADAAASELVDSATAREIAEAALRAEELFDAPQDIEFAHDGDRLWILQSRPITTVSAEGKEGWESEFDTPTDDATEWTSANVQEVLPGLLTPLTITTSRQTSRVGYNLGFQRLKMLDEDEWQPFMGTFYNRAFLNLTVTKLVADRAFGSSGEAVEEQYLAGDPNAPSARESWPRRLRFKALSVLPLAKTLLQLDAIASRMDQRTRELEREIAALKANELSNEELDATLERMIAYGASIFGTHLQVSGVASFGFELTRRLVQPVLKDDTAGRMPSLFSGMAGVESASIGGDIWELAVVARNSGIADTIRSGSFDPWAKELPDGWRAAWRSFVANHGHRGLNEMEASSKSWRRDPAPVVEMVVRYLDLPEDRSPAATLRRQEAERLRLTEAVARRMNPLKRRAFRKVLSEAQGWVALRERTKSVIVRAARIPEYLLPEVQRRLVDGGVIDQDDDLFFLTRDEIGGVLRGEIKESLGERVVRRRREYERNRHVVLPGRFRGRPVPLSPALPEGETTILRGTPVSPGIVTGRARVIDEFGPGITIEPGEILVAPVTDAGWTPLFALASGLVVDLGSALSHGSTVAREYGLPAVVNVQTGTRVIRTGDLLTVNGRAGTVTIARGPGES